MDPSHIHLHPLCVLMCSAFRKANAVIFTDIYGTFKDSQCLVGDVLQAFISQFYSRFQMPFPVYIGRSIDVNTFWLNSVTSQESICELLLWDTNAAQAPQGGSQYFCKAMLLILFYTMRGELRYSKFWMFGQSFIIWTYICFWYYFQMLNWFCGKIRQMIKSHIRISFVSGSRLQMLILNMVRLKRK